MKAKDASVDKIPPIQMNLEFLDMTGPVTIAAESAETMIKVTDRPSPPRPFERLEVTQTLDTRNLTTSGEILLEVSATASGLVPELDEVLDLVPLGERCPIVRVDAQDGALVRQLNSWGDRIHAVSERQWTVVLDGSAAAAPGQGIELELPPAKPADAAVTYRTYVDMDLVDLDGPIVAIGSAAAEHEPPPLVASVERRLLAGGIAVGAVVLVVALAGIIRWARGPSKRPPRARDVFRMPAAVDGFVVVRLLRAMDASDLVRLPDKRRAQMQEDIDRIEQSCFRRNGATEMSEDELKGVARKWLKIAC